MTKKILHITPVFNYSCGRSKLVYYYLDYFSNKSNYETHFITNGGDSLERLNNLPNLQYTVLKFSTGYKNIFFFWSFYNELKEYVKKNKINLIHTHHRFLELIAVRIARSLRLKTVVSTHGFVNGYQRVSFKSDQIVSVSNSTTEFLIDKFQITKDKIVTLYNPVKSSLNIDENVADQFKRDNGLDRNNKIILFVGRFTKDKGFDTLLKTFEILTSENNNIVFIAIGKCDSKYFILNKKIESRKFIFLKPMSDINYLYSIADIVVLPSRNDTFPYVMIEAGSFKKPLIGGKTGGISEFIEDGKNGLLIDPENPEQLTEKIIYLLNNPEIGKVLGENLYEKVNRLCEYNYYFKQVEKIYDSLIIHNRTFIHA